MAKSRSAKKGRRSGSARSRSARSSSGMRARSASGRTGGQNSARGRSARGAGGSRGRNGSGRDDAIALLKSDHREVERLFAEFERTDSSEQKRQLAGQICLALRTHTTIEEEIFYPAFLEATDEKDIHHEAEIEHEGAKHLIDEIESTGSRDDHFDARVTVLQEMIRHHVQEEEKRGGMFSKAQSSDMDLRELGQQLMERKLELMGETSDERGMQDRMSPQGRSRAAGREMRTRSS
jgi:hemerythrin superfamily protein